MCFNWHIVLWPVSSLICSSHCSCDSFLTVFSVFSPRFLLSARHNCRGFRAFAFGPGRGLEARDALREEPRKKKEDLKTA